MKILYENVSNKILQNLKESQDVPYYDIYSLKDAILNFNAKNKIILNLKEEDLIITKNGNLSIDVKSGYIVTLKNRFAFIKSSTDTKWTKIINNVALNYNILNFIDTDNHQN